jgi:hypothetical protein
MVENTTLTLVVEQHICARVRVVVFVAVKTPCS